MMKRITSENVGWFITVEANAGKPDREEERRGEGPPKTMISAYGGSAALQNADNSTEGEKKDY